jgi:hypothetical protein
VVNGQRLYEGMQGDYCRRFPAWGELSSELRAMWDGVAHRNSNLPVSEVVDHFVSCIAIAEGWVRSPRDTEDGVDGIRHADAVGLLGEFEEWRRHQVGARITALSADLKKLREAIREIRRAPNECVDQAVDTALTLFDRLASPSPSLDFGTLRTVNTRRCVQGFGHALESWSVAEWTNAMCGEAGEAANFAKKMIRHRDAVKGNSKDADKDLELLKRNLRCELADVVIYADLTAASQGIDLGEAVRETFNSKSVQIGSDILLPLSSGGPSPA